MQPKDRLIVALDRSSRDEILAIADELHDEVGMFKIGLQAFVANGPALVRELATRGERIFLDLKFHDIPNTASSAVAEAVALGAGMVNVHAAGGSDMMLACAAAVAGKQATLLAVTILTSLTADELTRIGMDGSPEANVLRLAALTKSCGLHGVVASPLEIRAIRQQEGAGFVILTPGIRAASDDSGDQKRTMTAGEAAAAGADYIVVGRPILASPTRRDAARRIVDELSQA